MPSWVRTQGRALGGAVVGVGLGRDGTYSEADADQREQRHARRAGARDDERDADADSTITARTVQIRRCSASGSRGKKATVPGGTRPASTLRSASTSLIMIVHRLYDAPL